MSSGSNVVHYLDAYVGETLVIENQLLLASMDPSKITYASSEISQPLSGDVAITVSKKVEGKLNAVYFYHVILDLVYNPTPQTTPAE